MILDGTPQDQKSKYVGTTDAALLSRIKSENQESWRELVETYTPFIYQIIRKSGLQPTDAADITQNIMLELINSLDKFDRQNLGAFRKWLRVVTRNKVVDFYRKQQNLKSLETDPAEVAPHHSASLKNSSDDEELHNPSHIFTDHQLQMQTILDQVQKRVTDQTWQAFQLMSADVATSEEIAQQLGMSAPAVRMAKKRVLAQIKIRWITSQQSKE